MKKIVSVVLVLSAVLAPSVFAAGEGGMDFSSITGAVNATTVVAAIAAIAAIKILPGVARWGFNQVSRLFK